MKKNGKFQKIATVAAIITLLIVVGKIVHSDGIFKGNTRTGITFLKETTGRIENKVDILIANQYGEGAVGTLITKKEKD